MTEECLNFESDGLNLEGMLVYDDAIKAPQAGVLICPPHPFLGGDMRNNVIRSLMPALRDQGFLSFTFNYRGIGKSQTDKHLEIFQKEFWEHSTSPEYEAKIFRDCRRAFDMLEQAAGNNVPLMIIGYSFGCLPAIDILNERSQVQKCILISPPLAKWKVADSVFNLKAETLLIYSPNDFACPEKDVLELFGKMNDPKVIQRIDGAGHFFVGCENQLTKTAVGFLSAMGYPIGNK